DTFSYTVIDAAGATSSATVSVTVTGVNDAPVLAAPVADQNATSGQAFSFQVPVLTFSDVDTGDTLTYSATLANGAALPTWLSFNAATRTFSGTPGAADVGNLSVRLTATDQGGLSATDTFAVSVASSALNEIIGTPFIDTLIGTAGGDHIVGLAGDDQIEGLGGNDLIEGGSGTNFLDGGAGDDTFVPGVGASDKVIGGDGFDQILGGAGDDSIGLYDFGGTASVERIDGGAGTNIIVG